jgi:hypothetical protein
LRICAGLPLAIVLGGMSLFTSAPGSTMQSSPMVIPGITMARAPRKHLAPIRVSVFKLRVKSWLSTTASQSM